MKRIFTTKEAKFLFSYLETEKAMIGFLSGFKKTTKEQKMKKRFLNTLINKIIKN